MARSTPLCVTVMVALVALLQPAATNSFVSSSSRLLAIASRRTTSGARRANGQATTMLFFKNKNKPLITSLTGRDAFTGILAEHPDKIVVVKFYAGFCKACKAMSPKFKQVAQQYATEQEMGVDAKSGEPSTRAQDFVFSEIEFMANRELCKSLGIKRLPAVHFYYGSHGKVEDFVCGPKKVSTLKDKLSAYHTYGMKAHTGETAPVFADDVTTDISKMYNTRKEAELKEELEVMSDSISDALEAAVKVQNAADDLEVIADSISWVLGQEEAADATDRQPNSTRVSS